MGRYINTSDIEVRLIGKVRLTLDPVNEPNLMSYVLLNRLIDEAEGQVEMDLSSRYDAPFSYDNGTDSALAFSNLPLNPTQNVIKTLCELMAVIRVLETDFGSSGPTDGSKYAESSQKRYNKMVETLTERRKDDQRWVKPPLPGLRLSYFNYLGDTGFSGQVLNTSSVVNHGNYPQYQINSPGENFFTGVIDEDEGTHG